MTLHTQIGGANASKVMALRDILVQQDIDVAHPTMDEPFFSKDDGRWQRYEAELAFYETIADSSLHIIYNTDGKINQELGLQCVYAMSKGKSLVFLHEPIFTSASSFDKKLIQKHVSRVHIANLIAMNAPETKEFLNSLNKPVDYNLTPVEEAHIKRQGKTHFRELLGTTTAS